MSTPERVIWGGFAIQIRKCRTPATSAWRVRQRKRSDERLAHSAGRSRDHRGSAAGATALGVESAEFQLADRTNFRRGRATGAALVVGLFHDHGYDRDVRFVLSRLPNFYRGRNLGK